MALSLVKWSLDKDFNLTLTPITPDESTVVIPLVPTSIPLYIYAKEYNLTPTSVDPSADVAKQNLNGVTQLSIQQVKCQSDNHREIKDSPSERAETWSILSNRNGRGLLESSSAPLGLYGNLNLIP